MNENTLYDSSYEGLDSDLRRFSNPKRLNFFGTLVGGGVFSCESSFCLRMVTM